MQWQELQKKFSKILKLENSVKLIGNVDNPLKYFSRADIFALSSIVEGLPNALVEAMMCGCAVVAVANEGVQEYITHNESGFLSPIGNVDAMIKNIQYLLDNPGERVRIAETGHERINKFSWEKSAKQLEKILIQPKCKSL